MNPIHLRLVSWCIAAAFSVAMHSSWAADAPRPNVLIIYSDDHGWADLGIQGHDKDVRTPNLDQLARDGVRFTRGYVTAPQCVPSRAALITGRYQQRFGVEDNNHGPLPLAQITIAERLQPAGYTSGWVGKCHLDVGRREGQAKQGQTGQGKAGKAAGNAARILPDHMPQHQGFAEYFRGELRQYHASHGLDGKPFADAPHLVTDDRFRVVVQTEAALSFLDRRAAEPDKPWLLYLAWYAPHVPLESPEPWFSQTPESLPKERRQALAMIAAMDDGLGRIRQKLREMRADRTTLIFFIGDNGAPLGSSWNGSRNEPLAGEKGMLAEGGIRTPFVAAWPERWPAGLVYDRPVINLDVAATAAAAAGLPPDPRLDGVDLTPFVTGKSTRDPHERLFWRWGSQAAVLEMPFKLIRLGDRPPLLFDVTAPEGEQVDRDLAASRPEVVTRLDTQLRSWAAELQPPGLMADRSAFSRHHEDLFRRHRLTAQAADPPRPNVLIVVNDDESWLECSRYGRSDVQTPAFDRVAKAGVLFRHGYCSSPSCAPARAALLTGRNFWELEQGAIIQAWLPVTFPTLPERLTAAGYHAGYTGKGWGPGVKEPTGTRADPAGEPWNTVRTTAAAKGLSTIDYAANLRQFLDAKPTGKPFYFWAGIIEPHGPWAADNHARLGVNLADLHLPGFVPDTPGVRRARANYLYEVQHADRSLAALLAVLEERGELANTLVIVTADNGTSLPRAKTNLYDWGVRVPLAMMWPARVPAGRTVDDFVGFPDLAPTILAAAGLPVPPELTGRSLLGTLLSNASGRVDPARDITVNGIEWHGNLPPIDIAARMIRDDRFAYIVNYSDTPRIAPSNRGKQADIRYTADAQNLDVLPLLAAHPERPELAPFLQLIAAPRPREELYDCTDDPDQLVNLADKPEFTAVKTRLRGRLEAYQRQTKDPRVTGDMALFAETTKYVQARKAAGYDDAERHAPKASSPERPAK